jgi:hypothetical protein
MITAICTSDKRVAIGRGADIEAALEMCAYSVARWPEDMIQLIGFDILAQVRAIFPLMPHKDMQVTTQDSAVQMYIKTT